MVSKAAKITICLAIVSFAHGLSILPDFTPDMQECGKIMEFVGCCSDKYQPVVGFSRCGDEGKIYDNVCHACSAEGVHRYIELEGCGKNCESEEIPAVNEDGEAMQEEEQQMACITLYQPVCGFTLDGESKTYGNSCNAGNSGDRIVLTHPGECYQKPNYNELQICERKRCFTDPQLPWPQCIPGYIPYCGYTQDGQAIDFNNQCEACESQQYQITHIKPGKCECGPDNGSDAGVSTFGEAEEGGESDDLELELLSKSTKTRKGTKQNVL